MATVNKGMGQRICTYFEGLLEGGEQISHRHEFDEFFKIEANFASYTEFQTNCTNLTDFDRLLEFFEFQNGLDKLNILLQIIADYTNYHRLAQNSAEQHRFAGIMLEIDLEKALTN